MLQENGDVYMNINSKNKKGQLYTLVFWIITFVIVWALFFGQFFSEWGKRAIIDNKMVGIEAFLWGNLNLFIGMSLLLVMFVGISQFNGDR